MALGDLTPNDARGSIAAPVVVPAASWRWQWSWTTAGAARSL